MALAHVIDHHGADFQNDADDRIRSAEFSDLAFALRRLLPPDVSKEDVLFVAKAINSMGGIGSITKSDLIARLREMGRSNEMANRLGDALFK